MNGKTNCSNNNGINIINGVTNKFLSNGTNLSSGTFVEFAFNEISERMNISVLKEIDSAIAITNQGIVLHAYYDSSEYVTFKTLKKGSSGYEFVSELTPYSFSTKNPNINLEQITDDNNVFIMGVGSKYMYVNIDNSGNLTNSSQFSFSNISMDYSRYLGNKRIACFAAASPTGYLDTYWGIGTFQNNATQLTFNQYSQTGKIGIPSEVRNNKIVCGAHIRYYGYYYTVFDVSGSVPNVLKKDIKFTPSISVDVSNYIENTDLGSFWIDDTKFMYLQHNNRQVIGHIIDINDGYLNSIMFGFDKYKYSHYFSVIHAQKVKNKIYILYKYVHSNTSRSIYLMCIDCETLGYAISLLTYNSSDSDTVWETNAIQLFPDISIIGDNAIECDSDDLLTIKPSVFDISGILNTDASTTIKGDVLLLTGEIIN